GADQGVPTINHTVVVGVLPHLHQGSGGGRARDRVSAGVDADGACRAAHRGRRRGRGVLSDGEHIGGRRLIARGVGGRHDEIVGRVLAQGHAEGVGRGGPAKLLRAGQGLARVLDAIAVDVHPHPHQGAGRGPATDRVVTGVGDDRGGWAGDGGRRGRRRVFCDGGDGGRRRLVA